MFKVGDIVRLLRVPQLYKFGKEDKKVLLSREFEIIEIPENQLEDEPCYIIRMKNINLELTVLCGHIEFSKVEDKKLRSEEESHEKILIQTDDKNIDDYVLVKESELYRIRKLLSENYTGEPLENTSIVIHPITKTNEKQGCNYCSTLKTKNLTNIKDNN